MPVPTVRVPVVPLWGLGTVAVTAYPPSGLPTGPTTSNVVNRSRSASMAVASFQSASTVTLPCCATSPRHLRAGSKLTRARSLAI